SAIMGDLRGIIEFVWQDGALAAANALPRKRTLSCGFIVFAHDHDTGNIGVALLRRKQSFANERLPNANSTGIINRQDLNGRSVNCALASQQRSGPGKMCRPFVPSRIE